MEKIELGKFNNTEYLEYLTNKFNNPQAKDIKSLDNYLEFLSSLKSNDPEFINTARTLFSTLDQYCWLKSAEDFFNYLLELIKLGKLRIEDIIYLINTSYLNLGFKSYLETYIASKTPPRFPHTMRKFSELDPIVSKLIEEYNLKQEKAI